MWLGFFLKFWIVSVFLQKPLAWFAKFYLRVQSKNWGWNNFLIFFSEIFRILSEKFFRLLSKKLQEVFRTTFYVSRGTVCGLNFFKSFESIWIFCRNLWHSSQTSIFVSKVKILEEIIFLIFFLEFFSDFERKIFQTSGRKTLRSFQNYLLRVQRNSLWLGFFLKFWIVSVFLQKPLAWFAKFYLRVQSKNCGRNNFLIFFSEIFQILSEKFFRLLAKKL